MYEVIIKERFSAAHQLRDFNGMCENLHGHNWKVEVVVEAERLNSVGVVIDFDAIRRHAKELSDIFDHQVLNEIPYFQDVNPSAENIARYFFEEIKRRVMDPRVADPRVTDSRVTDPKLASASSPSSVKVKKVIIWETDNCGASYSC